MNRIESCIANDAKEAHEDFFPLATVRTQKKKLLEEVNEYKKAHGKDKDSEAGDVLFVLCSLLRFPETRYEAKEMLSTAFDKFTLECTEMPVKSLKDTIERVQKRVRRNAYKFVNGEYIRKKD